MHVTAPGRRLTRRPAAWVLVAICLYAIFCSWLGVDFGHHWDEHYNVIRTAVWSVRNGTILPNWYYFPSLLHDLALVAAVPDAVALTVAGTEDLKTALAGRIDSEAFLLRLRRIVSVMSALTGVWVFLTLISWRKEAAEALLASAIVAGSWELQYHSRWLTADPLVAQFGALTLCLAMAGHLRRSPRLLRLAGVAAGLACAAKYPGGALLLPVLLACAFSERPLRRSIESLSLFAATFLIITPGALAQPHLLLAHLGRQLQIYGGTWGPFTVSGPVEHARLLGTYVALVQMSHFVPLALLLFLAAVAGAVVVLRTDLRAASIVLVFPVVYFAYFSMQGVMIVRNVQVLAPFLAVLSAIGIAEGLKLVRTRSLRAIAVAGLMAILLVNLGWLLYAAYSIAYRGPRDFTAAAAEYLDRNEQRTFALSLGVQTALREYDGRARARLPPAQPGIDAVVFFSREIPWGLHEANRWNYSERWFGSYEVNFNYYPTWLGRERIVVADPHRLRPFRGPARR